MKKTFTTFLLFFIFIFTALAQNFKGSMKAQNGEPIVGGTIYIQNTNQGLLCNEDGAFQTTLPVGTYKISFKCLGYKTKEKDVIIPRDEIVSIDVILIENPFELPQVEISSKEDPAYEIMRKAIAKAPIYAKAVDGYVADVYIKGNMELLKMPKIYDKLSQSEDGFKISELKGQAFVQESYNVIEYTSPDQYKQTVKAFSSSFPDNSSSQDAFGLINGSLYNPTLNGVISPLNEKSFSYYRFRYEGFSEEDGLTINKIKIIPKVKDPSLFEGYIYIADDTWHVSLAELISNVFFVKQNVQITYQSLAANVYLPVTYLMNIDMTAMGASMTFDYYTSLKYSDIKVKKEPEIAGKLIKERERKLELKWDENYKIESDSLATKRDSTYWKHIRVVPLSEKEIVSYIKKDSIQQHIDSMRSRHHNSKFSWGSILTGGQVGGDSTKIVFQYSGLLKAFPEYNYVDGLWAGQRFKLTINQDSARRLSFSPYLYYTISRKKFIKGIDIAWDYAPKRLGKLNISIGSRSEDFNLNGLDRLNSALYTLISGRNKSFFYQRDFVSIENKIELTNGLLLKTSFDISKRSGLKNYSDYTWGSRKKIRENIFPNDRFDRTAYSIQLSYSPYTYYRIINGRKDNVRVTSPTFWIGYSEGFSSWQKNNSQYRKVDIGIKQSIKLGYFSRFEYLANAGKFFSRNIHFADYQHFNTSNALVSFKIPFESYMLLDNYAASTNDYWLQGHINYTNRYLLLKRLPFLQGKMFTENLHLKTLYTPEYRLYTEVGYSIDLMRQLNLGTFVSFRKDHYEAFGVRASINLSEISDFF